MPLPKHNYLVDGKNLDFLHLREDRNFRGVNNLVGTNDENFPAFYNTARFSR